MRRPSAYGFFFFGEAATSLPAFVVVSLYWVTTVNLDPLELVLIGTVMEVTIFVFEVPTGIVADVFGRKRSIVLSWAIQGAAILLVASVPELWASLAGWALWGFGYTFSSGAWEAWITDEVGVDRIGPVFARGLQVGYAAALAGLPLLIGLASATSLRTGVFANGAIMLALALAAVPLMPETGFRRQSRGEVSRRLEALDVARRGFGLVRVRPVLVLLVTAAFFAGAYTEGFDRLSEAHFIRDVGLPSFAGLSALWWFALLAAAGLVIGLVSSQYLVRRLRAITRRDLAALLFAVCAFQAVAIVGFGLAGGFAVAVVTYLAVRLGRSLMTPLYMTWLNQSIDDSSVRATVISISGQADAIGQVAGGPGIGAVGRVFSIRAALVAAGIVLTPTLALYARALRHRGAEPELERLPAPVAP